MPLDQAGEGAISFLSDDKRLDQLQSTHASAVIIAAKHRDNCSMPALISANPYLSYAALTEFFVVKSQQAAGIHPTAVVSPSAKIAETAIIAAHAVIEADAVIGEHCEIGPGTVIGACSEIGDNSVAIRERLNLP